MVSHCFQDCFKLSFLPQHLALASPFTHHSMTTSHDILPHGVRLPLGYKHTVFGEKDWLSRVNLECKILPLRGYNFSILIFPGMGNEGFSKSQWESSAFRRITCIHRVRTNFWIQNSWLFPNYFQNNSLFSQTLKGYQIIMWSKETLKNARTRLFFRMHCKLTVTTVQCRHKRIMKLIHPVIVLATGKIEWDLTTEKIHLLSTCCNVEIESKKKIQTFYHFSRLYLYFRDFFQVWKIAL